MNGVLLVCLSLLVSAGSPAGLAMDPAVERVSHSAEPIYHSSHPIEGWGERIQLENPIPMVLDEFMIDTSIAWVGARDYQWHPSVAFDGTNYLVVWHDHRNGKDFGIYGTRVDQAGTVLDPYGFVISDTIRQQSYPSVAFDGTNYLVVWHDIRRKTDSDIYGTRVDPSGMVLDPSGVAISAGPSRERHPSIIFDGTNYFVVWEDALSMTECDIYGARVDPSGTVLDPSGIVISGAPSIQRSPSVSWDGTNYLVVWEDFRHVRTTSQIYGARVDRFGSVLDTLGAAICTGPGLMQCPSVAFDGTDYLVVWEDWSDRFPPNIYALQVDPSLRMIDTTWIPIAVGAGYQGTPSVAFSGGRFTIVWEERFSSGKCDIYGAVVRIRGTEIEVSVVRKRAISDEPGWQRSPSLALGDSSYLVVWGDHRGLDGDIYAARVDDSSGRVFDPSGIAISNWPDHKWFASVASDGSDYLAVWMDYRNGAGYDIYGARVTQSGDVLDPQGIPISCATGSQSYPSVAFNGTNYLVVWEDWRDGFHSYIFGTRISLSGVVLDSSGIPISAGPSQHWDYYPSIVSNGRDYLVVWGQDWQRVRAARVDSSGTVLDQGGMTVSDSVDRVVYPSAASDGYNYLVTWEHRGDIFGARVSQSGTILDPTAIPICTTDGYQHLPSVDFDGAKYFVAWQDQRHGCDIYGARVDTAGMVLEPLGIEICAIPEYQGLPFVGFDGANHFVVWEDARDGTTHIYGARVDTSGTVLDSTGLKLTDGAHHRLGPRIAVAASGEMFLTYDGYADRPYDGYRVFGASCTGVGIDEDRSRLNVGRSRVELFQNKPNPFHGHTEIGYNLPSKASVALKVYDSSGRLVNTLVDEERVAGSHTVIWNGRDKSGLELPSGIYFYRLQAASSAATNKMIMLR